MSQIRKQILTIGLLLAVLSPNPAVSASIVTTIVTNPLTGVAIDGFDPVSYFAESQPAAGSPGISFDAEGVTWYFSSEANRDAFKSAPDAYVPAFGGHDAMQLARNFLSDSNPRIYLLLGQRLYLFYSAANRDAFVMSPKQALGDALKNWDSISKTLSTQ